MRYDELRKALDPVLVQPANLVKSCPQLGCLIDVNLASLLGIRLAEILLNFETFQASHKHSALAGQVSCSIESQVGCERELVRVEQVTVGVVAKIDRSPLPIDLETVGLCRQRAHRWAVIGQGIEVLVLAARCRSSARGGIGRGVDS